ncbi:hypothetical protein EXS66_01530 [Candidatus Saccharibacteria bacterium]|nr:hypothetical protein [Candidatus Saccharibacteria bacterium]
MKNSIYNNFKSDIEEITAELCAAEKSPAVFLSKDFTALIERLEHIARDRQYNELPKKLLDTAHFRNLAHQTRRIYELFEVFLETSTYFDIVSGKIDFLKDQFIDRTFEFAKKESLEAGFTPESKVIFIGGGPFPETAIAYSKQNNCKITILDNNAEAVVLSTKIISELRLDKTISIRYSDAKEYDFSGYTHIVVAALARPKPPILRQICDTMRIDAVVVCRSVEGLRVFIYEPANDELLEHFNHQSKVYGDDKTIVHSLILKKYSDHSHS